MRLLRRVCSARASRQVAPRSPSIDLEELSTCPRINIKQKRRNILVKGYMFLITKPKMSGTQSVRGRSIASERKLEGKRSFPPKLSTLGGCAVSVVVFFSCVSSAVCALLELGRGARGEAKGPTDVPIVRCTFVSGVEPATSSLSSFFVPASDRSMYEEGLKEYLQQIGSNPSELRVVCTPYQSTDAVSCQLCLYNEVSRDLKHVRQGQVLGASLHQCMLGTFDQASKMALSQFHPICYPEDREAAPSSSVDGRQRRLTQPAKTDESISKAQSVFPYAGAACDY